jgi:hypothetical protein
MNDARHLISLYTTNPMPYTGPRIYARGYGGGFKIWDAKRESLDSIVQDVNVYVRSHVDMTCLDVWARMTDNTRRFCPLVDAHVPQGTPPPVKPSGIIAAGDWSVYIWILDQRASFTEYDRVEALRFRLASLGARRQSLDEGFPCPGSVVGLTETQRTQELQYYSYGPVKVPLTGNVETRAVLDFFDVSRKVSLAELEAIAPQVSKPRTLAQALAQAAKR